MSNDYVARVNGASFVVCLASILAGVAVALLGIWRLIPMADGTLWRALGTCGVVFAGSVCTSLAVRCFKTNA